MTLAQISASQAQKETVANENFAAVAPNALFARKYTTTTGLTWGYYGGILPGTFVLIADGTIALTNAATNYVECDSAGTVYVNQVAFTAGRQRLYSVVCAGGVITSYTDYRTTLGINYPTVTGDNTWSGQNTFAIGTITVSKPVAITQTWNAGGVTFDALTVDVTDTASAAASRLIDLKVGGSSKFAVTKAGAVTAAGGISGTTLTASGNIVLPDAALIRLATVDGSDTGQLYLAAASADGPTRGAHVQLFGNERATFGGQLYLNAGDVSGGNIYLRTGNGIVGLQVDRGAGGSVAGAVTIPGTLGVTGLASYANNIASTGGQAPVIGTTAAVLMGYGGSQPSVHFVDTARTTNNKRAELHFSGGSVIGRWVNDDYNAATNWLEVAGGYAAGTTSVKLPSLAGTGTRAVVADANGVLSAP